MPNQVTFLHISDLHLGTVDPNTLDAKAIRLCSFPIVAGLLGHSSRAIHYLEEFNRELSRKKAQVIVTGDLTAFAGADQFEMANDFLGTVWSTQDLIIGLKQADWHQRAVPGNHDHWSGQWWNFMFGGPTPTMASTFSPPWLHASGASVNAQLQPFIGTPVELDSGHTIQFLAIDTDADVPSLGWHRFQGRGLFLSQLEELSRALRSRSEASNGKEVRVLLLHHSQSYQGRALSMSSTSRRALESFILDQDIAVLLTGHIHEANVSVHTIANGDWKTRIFEARCGSTTQSIDRYRKLAARPGLNLICPTIWLNSLLVHEVSVKTDGIYWKVQVWQLTTEGFRKATNLPDGGRVELEHRVWPSQREKLRAATT